MANVTRCVATAGPLFSRSVADEDHVLVAVVRAEVEPAVERIHDEPRLAEEAEPLRRREPVQAEGRGDVRRAHDSESVRLVSSQSARSKIPGSRSSQRPPVSSMSSRLGAKTSKTKRPPGSSSAPGRAQRTKLRLPCGAASERADGEGHALGDGGSRRSPSRRSTRPETPADLGGGARDSSISGDESTPITRSRLRRSGPRSVPFRPRARRRAARRERVIDVERDVFRDRAAPRVVERRDLVVLSHAGFRATQTNSRLSPSNGRRSNQPYSASVSRPDTSSRPSHLERDQARSRLICERDVDSVVGRCVLVR